MKPRLLKFTCHSCGARLAVPPEMAGLSDHCPKCGVLVTAPTIAVAGAAPVSAPSPVPAAVPAAPEKSVPPEWSAGVLADALKPERRPESQLDLLQPVAESHPIPGAPEVVSTRKPAHEVLDSILRRPEPSRRPAEPEGVTAATAEATAPAPPATALMPQRVTDAREVEKAAMPGMGEVLAGAVSGGMMSASQESRPVLHVPFVPVSSSPRQERRAWTAHLKIMGIICFVLVDVLLVFVYKDEIAGLMGGGRSAGEPVGTVTPPEESSPKSLSATRPGPLLTESPVPPVTPAPAAAPSPGITGGPPLTPLPGGLVVPASGSVVPSLPSGMLTIASPTDFPSSPRESTPSTTPQVPMAIPLPGHSTENVPTATPVPAVGKTEPPRTTEPEAPPAPTPSATPASAPSVMPASSLVAPTTPTAASIPAPPPVPSVTDSPPPAAAPEAPAPAPVVQTGSRRISKVPAEAKSAVDALLKFLDAPNASERAAFVQKPEVVRAAMEKHAATFGDGPVVVSNVDFVERYPSKAGVPPYCMFEVSGGSLSHPVMVLVEQSPKSGARIDWEAFSEFKDDLLLRFLENKGAPPQKFRVLLRRKHYFDKDVPDIAGKDSFQLQQPNAKFEGHVFVQRNGTLGRQLANQLGWGEDIHVIAELVWKSDAKSWWVELGSIASYGWRG